MKRLVLVVLGGILVAGLLTFAGAFYTVDETQQVVITRFGEPVGDPIVEPGLHVKLPFVHKANFFEKRFLEWDGASNQLPTRDKRFIHVDTYARWRVTDPLLFFQRLTDERGAQSRLDDILDGETRNTIANHDLIEVVRTSNRDFAVTEDLGVAVDDGDTVREIANGRDALAAEVLLAAQGRTSDLGIEILDFRFKRINYVEEVRREVYSRMISERQRIAEQFRSEGAGEAARIRGEKERELRTIGSQAYREAQEIMGAADATAADVYAAAYGRDADFYRFVKTLETYRETLRMDTTLLLGTDGEFLRYLENSR
ncbi:MAG: protease modulator HflC [Acidobacteria bacterium]|nr:protease modulator HflC [Acidobacteriota bacterium]